MTDGKFFRLAAGVLVAIGFCSPLDAGSSKGPTTWWPDPATGLMWPGSVSRTQYNWAEAQAFCANLQIGGFTGWRMPTRGELVSVSDGDAPVAVQRHIRAPSAIPHVQQGPPDLSPEGPILTFKGNIVAPTIYYYWSSSPAAAGQMWTVYIGGVPPVTLFRADEGGDGDQRISKVTDRGFHSVLCTRSMEPELRQLATDAQVASPVPDVQTLKAWAPIAQAHASFKNAQYQAAVQQADAALALKPNFAPALWAAGVSCGMLSQWDLAVTNLQSAVRIDKKYNNGKAALKWAQQGQKAAKKGETPKDEPPAWP